MEKTNKTRGRPKKTVLVPKSESVKDVSRKSSIKSPKKELPFVRALWHIRTNGKPGSYRKFMKTIKNKFGITLKYDNYGDDYAVPDLYFMKGKKECSREEMDKVKKYVIDYAKTM